MTDSLSVVVPVYRTENMLPELYRQLLSTLEATGRVFEIVFIEDCGGDGSWGVIKTMVSQDPRVRGLKLSRNFGQHNAVLCGIRMARHDIIVTMDDDLQHRPDQIPIMLAKLDEGFDVVYGVPQSETHGLLRDVASRLTKLALQSAMGAKNARNVSAFRVLRSSLRQGFEDYRSPNVAVDVLLTWSTQSFGAVKTRHDARTEGVSSYTFGKLINHAFNLMTGFSTLPLRFVSIIGFVFTFFGICILFVVLGIYFAYGSAVPGFVFLVTIISIFSGVQLFALGILGEYMARMFSRTMDKPAYVVGEIANNHMGNAS